MNCLMKQEGRTPEYRGGWTFVLSMCYPWLSRGRQGFRGPRGQVPKGDLASIGQEDGVDG